MNNINQNFESQNRIDIIRQTFVHLTTKFCESNNYLLSKDEINTVANCVVIDWMYRWLQNDKNASQTMRSFSIKKYVSQNELSKGKILVETQFSKAKYDRLIDASQMFQAMVKIRAEQYEEESTMVHPTEPELDKTGIPQSFLKLRYLDLAAENKLELYRMMLFRKEALKNSSDKGNNESLKYAYENYDSVFSEIREMKDPKEYVIACLQIHLFEISNRFHFMAKMASYMHNHNLLVSYPSTLNAKYFIGRYASEFKIADSYDILNYDKAIDTIFSNDKKELEHQFQIRKVLYIMNRVRQNQFPIEVLPEWTYSTYQNAYDFFKNYYPIAEMYVPVQFEEDGKNEESTHNKIIALYNLLPTLQEYREGMKGYRK